MGVNIQSVDSVIEKQKQSKNTDLTEQRTVVDKLQKIFNVFEASEGAIRPHFIMTGPSGSGKSHIINTMAKEMELGYLEINAAQLTKEGTSGNSLSKALAPLQNIAARLTICFVDEFDKLFISGNENSSLAHEITNGVQNEFLKVLESETTEVYGNYAKYHSIPVDNVLFVFAGAFNGEEDLSIDRLREFGIKTEFLGRVGLIFNLQKLSLESMRMALEHSELLNMYLEIMEGSSREHAIETINEAVEANHSKNTLGIRLLNTLINQYFINDGVLGTEQVKQTSFQKKLSFGGKVDLG